MDTRTQPVDVDTSPFIKYLNETFPSIYHSISANDWILCIPKSLIYTTIPLDLLSSLILTHSSGREFQTLNHKSVSIKGHHIETGQGFADSLSTTILHDGIFS